MENENNREIEDNFTTELFKELKERNKRDSVSLKISIIINFLIVAAFLIYLFQYDFSATITQTGVYTISDSSGNVISTDISPEELEKILVIINGDNKSD